MSIFDYITHEQQRSADESLTRNRASRAKAFTDWQKNQIELGNEVDPLELKRAATAMAGGDPLLSAMLPLDGVAKAYTEGVNRQATNTRLSNYSAMMDTEAKIRETAWSNYDPEKTPEENAQVFAPNAPAGQQKEMAKAFSSGLPDIMEKKRRAFAEKLEKDRFATLAQNTESYERATGYKLKPWEKAIADQHFQVRDFANNQAAKAARAAVPGQTPTMTVENLADVWKDVRGAEGVDFGATKTDIASTGVNKALSELAANQVYRNLLRDGKTDQATEMAKQAFQSNGVLDQLQNPDAQARLKTVNEGAVIPSRTEMIDKANALTLQYTEEARKAAETAIGTTAFTKMFEGSSVYKGISNSTGLRLQLVNAFRDELLVQGRGTHEFLLSSEANKAMLSSFINQNVKASVVADGAVNVSEVSKLVEAFLANPAVKNDAEISNSINSVVGGQLKKIPYLFNPMDAISRDANEQRAATQKVIDYVSGPVTGEEDANKKAKILDTLYAKNKSVIEQHKAYLNKLKYDPDSRGLLAKGLLDNNQEYNTSPYEAEIKKLEEDLSMITEARNKIGTNITKDGAAPQYHTPENTKAATPDLTTIPNATSPSSTVKERPLLDNILDVDQMEMEKNFFEAFPDGKLPDDAGWLQKGRYKEFMKNIPDLEGKIRQRNAPPPSHGGASFPPGYNPFNHGMSPDPRQSFPGGAAPQPAPSALPPQPTPYSEPPENIMEKIGKNTGYKDLQAAAYNPNNEQLTQAKEQTRDNAVDYDAMYGDVTPMEVYLNALSEIESSHGKFLQASTSSASGRFQFIDSTWKTIAQKYGATFGFTEADRGDPRAEALAAAALTMESVQIMSRKLGRQVSMGETYMAHFLGPSRAVKMIRHLGTGQLAAHLFPAAAKANKNIFYNKQGEPLTVDQVYAKLNTKVERAINNGDEGVKIFDFTEGGELKDGANLGRDA